MKSTDPTRCHSCLGPLTDENIVQLNGENRLPCCIACWSEIPVSVRLSIAREAEKLTHDIDAARATKAGWDQVREFFRAAQAGDLARLSPYDIGQNWSN